MPEYDLVVFGAAGFTGKYVVETIVKTLRSAAPNDRFTYAVAVRSEDQERLDVILEELSEFNGEDLTRIPRIIADASDHPSMVNLAKSCKVLLNCVGPYRVNGREVVQACIEGEAHCVDISGEAEYLEGVQMDFHEEAKKSGVYVVGSCGFESIPVDLGLIYLIRNFGGDVNSAEAFLEMPNSSKSKMSYGSWASVVGMVANARKLQSIRQYLFGIEPIPPQPKYKLESRSILHRNEIVESWCLPFPGPDPAVARRSQNLLYHIRNERPVQVNAYMKTPSLLRAVGLLVGVLICVVLVRFPFGIGRWLLLTFPRAMSFGYAGQPGPSREEMENAKFIFTLHGRGWKGKLACPEGQHEEEPDIEKIVKVHGSNPGYGAACVIMLQSALTILRESDKMPFNGGVYPPAAAFSETGLIERLHKHGVTFEIQDA